MRNDNYRPLRLFTPRSRQPRRTTTAAGPIGSLLRNRLKFSLATFLLLWKGQRYRTSRVHGARMCLTIKLFWVKSALISFHSISVLQGSLVRERSAEITCFKHAGTLARNPFGLANPYLQGFRRCAREIAPPTRPSLRRDRFTVPDKMIVS